MKPEILVAAREPLIEVAAERLERLAAEAIAARGRFAVALPGGSVATLLFPRFARANVDWHRCEFFWSDERAVTASSPDSNYGLADRLWLRPASVPPANVHRLGAAVDNPAELAAAAESAEQELIRRLGEPPRLDLLLLGVGEDGHIASLFPGHPLLAERRRHVAALTDSPKPPPWRLTLTLAAITAARRVIFAAFGSPKAAAIAAALRDPDCDSPLALAIAASGSCSLLLDPAAALELP